MRISQLIVAGLLVCACSQAQVKQYGVKVVNEYPHDDHAYTQGLFFHEGTLYETTGQYGTSSIRTVALESGEPILKKKLSNKYFGEGSVVLNGVLYVLTWTNKVVFRYDPVTLTYKSTVAYPREGWGITTDGQKLIASDGSSWLYFLDPETLKTEHRVRVTLKEEPLANLNELEYIDGKVWANVYTTNDIVIINPSDGKVEAVVDCRGLLPSSLKTPQTDVLNGIAQDASGRIFLTGKNWPRLYEIELVNKKK